MTDNVKFNIESQVSDHLKENSPLFVSFLAAYYRYASQRNKAIGVIQNNNRDVDVDESVESYIDRFYGIYAKYFPKNIAMDKRNFIKLLSSIYNAKGTEKALQVIFQAMFNENIAISFPGENGLRASDGIWVKEQFITLKTLSGTRPTEPISFSFTNSLGDFSFESTKVESIGSDLLRVNFNAFNKMVFVDDQLITQYDAFGVLTYSGILVYSPSTLTIVDPGKSWVVGQVVVIPGTIKDTIAKVLSVNSIGSITNLEILEYGFNHDHGQLATVSAFDTKPYSSTVEIINEVTSFYITFGSEVIKVYHHHINIQDHVGGVDELIDGNLNSGEYTFSQTNIQSPPKLLVDSIGISVEDWLDSRAVIMVGFSRIVNIKGFYKNSLGQISNQEIKMQDNYYYQAFSYLLETARDITEYRSLLNIIHPAGTKRFSLLSKAAELLLAFSSDRTLSVDNLFLLTIYDVLDQLANDMTKPLTDEALAIDALLINHLTKVVFGDTYTATDFYINHLNKVVSDPVDALDVLRINFFYKVLADSVTATESISSFNVSKLLLDSYSTIELYANHLNKYGISDSVTASGTESASVINDDYDLDVYFAEQYTVNQYKLSIGY